MYLTAISRPSHQRSQQYEPRVALTDNADGLAFYRRIATESLEHLQPGGS